VASKELRQPIALFSGPVNVANTQQLLIARPSESTNKNKTKKKMENRSGGRNLFSFICSCGRLAFFFRPVFWADF